MGRHGRAGSLLLLTGTLPTTMLQGSIALRCTVRPGRAQTQTDYIMRGLKSGQADGATGAAHRAHSWKLGHLKKWPTRTSTKGYVFVGRSWTRASRWPSEQTEQWLAPLPRCHQGQVQTLCWPAAPADTATRPSGGFLQPGHGVDIF